VDEFPTALPGPLVTVAEPGPITVLLPVFTDSDPELTIVTPPPGVVTTVDDRVAAALVVGGDCRPLVGGGGDGGAAATVTPGPT
jgi:hypothetical protein